MHDEDYHFESLINKRLLDCQIFNTRLCLQMYQYIIDLKNFEIIAVIDHFDEDEEIEGYYNPSEFNKIYSCLGV